MRILAAGVLALTCLLSACAVSGDLGSPVVTSANQAGVGTTIYAPGQRPRIPVLTGQTIDGTSLTSSSFSGKVVVLNAWASWCEPCQQESPALARIAAKVRPLGIDFIGLDEQDTTANAQAFAKKAGTDYPHLFDEKGELLASVKLLPTSGIPSTLVIDRKGLVAARVIGVIHENEFEALLRSLAQE